MNLNWREQSIVNRLFARVYVDVMTTSMKSGISEAVLTDYVSKMLGSCCINPEDEEL